MELWEKLHKIADVARPKLQREFLRTVYSTQDKVNLSALRKAISTGDISKAWKAMNWEKAMQTEMTPMIQSHLLKIIADAGPEALGGVPDLQMSFDVQNPEVYDAIKNETGKLITQITEQTRRGVVDAVTQAFRMGLGPPEGKVFDILKNAANIQESLGLNARQMGALNKYRLELAKKGITGTSYTKMVGQYRTNLLKQRAAMIARTETIQAACEGQRLAWDQAIKAGELNPARFEVEWIVTPDDVPCKRCMSMKGQRRPINGIYMTGEGRGTKGPTLHPHCRCGEKIVKKPGVKDIVIKSKRPGQVKPPISPIIQPPTPAASGIVLPPPTEPIPPEEILPPSPALSPKEQALADWNAIEFKLRDIQNPALTQQYGGFMAWDKAVTAMKIEERTAYYKYVDLMNDAEYAIERRKLTDSLAVFNNASKITKTEQKMIKEKIAQGSGWIPFDMLDTLKQRLKGGVVFQRGYIRSYYGGFDRKIVTYMDVDNDVIAHELSHAIDDVVFGQTPGGWTEMPAGKIMGAAQAGGTGFKWVNNRWISAQDGARMRAEYHSLHLNEQGTYSNGDGNYWKDNWISNYEGRIYNDSADGVEWWSMNCQRYSNYAKELETYSVKYSKIQAEYKTLQEAGQYGSFRAQQLQLKLYNMKRLGAEEWAAKESEWNRVKEKYPELAKFIESKFPLNKRITGSL